MRQTLKKMLLVAWACLAIVCLIGLDYFLPEKQIVKITGVEVKLTDKDGPISKTNPMDGPVNDVYYIYTENPARDIRVFRNEDTVWSFPFYFKFNSADLQAKAASLQTHQQDALITSYGWRLSMLSQFPNITTIELAEANAATFSFWRWFWFSVVGLLFILGFYGIHRLFKVKPAPLPEN
ncbi:DUF1523 family protein [Chitinibacter bivalviorum]|uniref:DUF1523 family protein n=1 Tax=Chitinibacter bivalviorum TaxID=2739434 RepID=A0A7H9BFU9_9NEIS|nr:DUF1523 family protein [Chitinibacter bivalviorum]QLG87455.1 DUF1523 family protein [Chitinibacter bivalviorum]